MSLGNDNLGTCYSYSVVYCDVSARLGQCCITVKVREAESRMKGFNPSHGSLTPEPRVKKNIELETRMRMTRRLLCRKTEDYGVEFVVT